VPCIDDCRRGLGYDVYCRRDQERFFEIDGVRGLDAVYREGRDEVRLSITASGHESDLIPIAHRRVGGYVDQE
jgi:hypothetical protein